MGEIIIKVPEDIKKEYELDVPAKKIEEKINEIKKEGKVKFLLENFDKVKHSVKLKPYTEEDIYIQED